MVQIRTLRNKVKQVILIQGKPENLFKKKEVKSYTLKFKDKEIKLGHVSEDLINTIKDMNKYAIITSKLEEKLSPLSIPEFPGLVFGKSGNNTTITIASDTEENLAVKVNNFTEHLLKQGIITSERCHWVCAFDKAKQIAEDKGKINTQLLSDREKSISELGKRLLTKGD